MEEFYVGFLQKYAWLPWLLLVVAAILIGVSFWQGRSINIFGLQFGPKPIPQPPPEFNTTSNAVANPVININTELSSEDLQKLADEISSRIQEIRTEEPKLSLTYATVLPPLSGDLEFLLRARIKIYAQLYDLVARNDGWAGVSLAPLEQFLELAIQFKRIPNQIVEDIKQFLYLTNRLFSGGSTGGPDIDDARILALHIMKDLEEINQRMPKN